MHEGNIKFIIDFNKYSTFVHGGPIADSIMNRISRDLRNSSEFFRVFSMSFVISRVSTSFFFNFMSVVDKESYEDLAKYDDIETYLMEEE